MGTEAKDIRTDGKRRYSAEDTKAVLMENALRAFTAAGFDDVGVREIAQAAGVNPSLVNRYFGSKQGLFEAMLDQMPSAQDFMGPDQGQWGAQIAKMLVVKIGKEPDIDPLLIMLRSAQSKGVGALVHRVMEETMIAPFAKLYGNSAKAKAKSRLVLSIILGVDVIERVINLPHPSEAIEDFENLLGAALQSIVDA